MIGPRLDSEYAEQVDEAAKSSAGSLVVCGPVAQEELCSIVRVAHAFVNSSKSEGQSSAILEAMVIGVPVFARDIPGNRALICAAGNQQRTEPYQPQVGCGWEAQNAALEGKVELKKSPMGRKLRT